MTTGKTTNDDAIALLTADHKKVRALFAQFSKLQDSDDEDAKSDIVAQICDELTIHTQIEEEIFYPAVRKAIDDEDLMDEAVVEHAGAKDLVEQLQDMEPDDDLYNAKVTVLGEQIDHHVEEEEENMFVQAKKAKVDTHALAAKMIKRKQELQAEISGDAEEDEGEEINRAPPKKTANAKRGSA